MEIEVTKIFAVTAYKICSLCTGLILSYLGYKLFMAGIWGNAGDAEGQFGENRLLVRKAAPGTFFTILGAIVILATVFVGLKFESYDVGSHSKNEKPPLTLD